MSVFETYLSLGVSHITDFNAYDHMVFLLALCAFQDFRHWKRLLILITAFTIGHSLTLVLAALGIFHFPVDIIEFLIPLTIFVTSVSVFFTKSHLSGGKWIYSLILVFGLIHGLGFSNYLIQLLGEESSILLPLFAFNVGIELGQLFVVISILIVKTIVEFLPHIERLKFRYWLAGISAGVSIVLMIETKFW